MTERLFQFIWQFQYFSRAGLYTVSNEPVEIIHPGSFNSNQGPDFLNSRIRIGEAVWAGNVELHLRTSDWNRHRHNKDNAYDNVILHVVWEDDGWINPIPVIELQGRISTLLLDRYDQLLRAAEFIPCERQLASVPASLVNAWMEELVPFRLRRKSKEILEKLQHNRFHWEETFWWMIARNFGLRINADCFEQVARSLPLSVLAKYKTRVDQLEALLMGQAGLLDQNFRDKYPVQLQNEYSYFRKLYKLNPVERKPLFMRMRPSGFPTVRLAQLACLVHETEHLFQRIKDEASARKPREWFNLGSSAYWDDHYRFDEPSSFQEKRIGQAMINSIFINTVCPLLFTYGQFSGEKKLVEKSLRWLKETPAEQNLVTDGFGKLGITLNSAFDSQALIELKSGFCESKRCLDCSIGRSLLNLTISPSQS